MGRFFRMLKAGRAVNSTSNDKLTYCMVQNPSWEANWFAASQEIPRISRNLKAHYRTYKRPPPVSILGQPKYSDLKMGVAVPPLPHLSFHHNLLKLIYNSTSNVLRAGRSGIESRWGRDFPSVQTGPGAYPASCKTDTGSFPGIKCGRGVLLTTHPVLVPRSCKSRAIPLPTLWASPGL